VSPLLLKPQDLVPAKLKLQPVDKNGWDSKACVVSAGRSGPLWLPIPGASPCYPLTGLLVVRNEQVVPAKAGAKLDDPETNLIAIGLPAPPPEEIQSQILFRSFWVAALSVAIGLALAMFKRRYPWSPVAGSPDWDFGKSWSANATLFLGLLTALLAFGGLPPQTTILPRNSYSILSLIAIAMIGMGPLIYAMILRDVSVGGRQIRVGVLVTLYLAGLVVLWATYIQFGLVWLILVELTRADVLTVATNRTLDVGLAAMAAVVFVYGFLSLRLVAIDSEPQAPALQPEAQVAVVHGEFPAPAEQPNWHLL